MKLIDAHTHCGNNKQTKFYDINDVMKHLAETEAETYDAVIFAFPEDMYRTVDSVESRNKANEYVLAVSQQHENIYPFYFVWNDYIIPDNLQAYAGIKWHRHADEPRYDYNDPKCEAILKRIRDLNLPVTLEEEYEHTVHFIERNEGHPVIIPPTILINTHPFFTAVMAHFFIPGDELNIRKTLGLIVAFSGVLIIFRGNLDLQLSYLLGDLLVLISGFLLGSLNVLTKRLIQYINSYRLLTWEMLLSLPCFFALSFFFEGIDNYHFSYPALSAILYQGLIVAGFCFVAWTLILKRHSPSKLSVLFFATPLFGVLLSIIFLHEPITWNLAFGAVFVAVGIYIVNRA